VEEKTIALWKVEVKGSKQGRLQYVRGGGERFMFRGKGRKERRGQLPRFNGGEAPEGIGNQKSQISNVMKRKGTCCSVSKGGNLHKKKGERREISFCI